MPDPARRKRALSAGLGPRRGRLARLPTPPGAPVRSGDGQAPHITVITWSKTAATEDRVATADEALAKIAPAGVTWINVDGLGDPKTLARLAEHFGLHPLALEDVQNVPQRPKVERYDKHMFMILRTIRLEAGEVLEEQISMFFGAGWLLTIQERSDGDCFNAMREAIRHGRGRVRDAGADYAAYLIMDAVVDAYFPVIEHFGERMQNLESAAIDDPRDIVLVQMQRVRHQLLSLRRAVWPTREEVGVMLREESDLITPETRVFLRDVYDHAVQALEIVESLRETAVSVMEVYLSVQNQRLNEIMKVLTVIATLFIPLTFIASIYGMNFKHMPELEWRYGYAWALGLMALTTLGLVGYFRRKGWW